MNLLDLVPPLRRQIRQYISADTDSTLAGYIADAVDALNWRWNRSYEITTIAPNSYTVDPNISAKDKRPIILMAGIIYKMGTTSLASFKDGDFAYDPLPSRRTDPFINDLAELKDLLPSYPTLVSGFTAPLRGYQAIWNKENYNYFWGLLW